MAQIRRRPKPREDTTNLFKPFPAGTNVVATTHFGNTGQVKKLPGGTWCYAREMAYIEEGTEGFVEGRPFELLEGHFLAVTFPRDDEFVTILVHPTNLRLAT